MLWKPVKRYDYLYHAERKKSSYKGGFVMKNGRLNNTKDYNHDYYMKNKNKWNKEEKDPEGFKDISDLIEPSSREGGVLGFRDYLENDRLWKNNKLMLYTEDNNGKMKSSVTYERKKKNGKWVYKEIKITQHTPDFVKYLKEDSKNVKKVAQNIKQRVFKEKLDIRLAKLEKQKQAKKFGAVKNKSQVFKEKLDNRIAKLGKQKRPKKFGVQKTENGR